MNTRSKGPVRVGSVSSAAPISTWTRSPTPARSRFARATSACLGSYSSVVTRPCGPTPRADRAGQQTQELALLSRDGDRRQSRLLAGLQGRGQDRILANHGGVQECVDVAWGGCRVHTGHGISPSLPDTGIGYRVRAVIALSLPR